MGGLRSLRLRHMVKNVLPLFVVGGYLLVSRITIDNLVSKLSRSCILCWFLMYFRKYRSQLMSDNFRYIAPPTIVLTAPPTNLQPVIGGVALRRFICCLYGRNGMKRHEWCRSTLKKITNRRSVLKLTQNQISKREKFLTKKFLSAKFLEIHCLHGSSI